MSDLAKPTPSADPPAARSIPRSAAATSQQSADQPATTPSEQWEQSELEDLIRELEHLRDEMVRFTVRPPVPMDAVHPNNRASAENLLHYMALRRRDLRSLQNRLAPLGLSSIGRAEGHALATVDAVLRSLRQLAGVEPPQYEPPSVRFADGPCLLAGNAKALFGPPPARRDTYIMVTMPTEAADDPSFVLDLLKRGMDCMRINCAHDDAGIWTKFVEHLRRAERELGVTCRVLMDLAGPKIRTGPLEPGPAVMKVRPRRDRFGRVLTPARLWLSSANDEVIPPKPIDAVLRISDGSPERLLVGDVIRFTDTRGSSRKMQVIESDSAGCVVEIYKTAYFAPGVGLSRESTSCDKQPFHAVVGDIPPVRAAIDLRVGDTLVLRRGLEPGYPASYDDEGKLKRSALIGCTRPSMLDGLLPGDRIRFDDGRIAGIVETMDDDGALIHITHTRPGGGKLRANQGINIPDSNLNPDTLTEKDRSDLQFIAEHADLVALSFAGSPEDVTNLQSELSRFDRRPSIVLKVETRRGFENLPAMLLAAMREAQCGVMIARGDLAVECGFERLAEVQEEVLWISEAAHVPVIWATQVLEGLAKSGMPSRAEITDAAMGHRAECVMLNKGPHIVEAVTALADILHRMRDHHSKKRSMLRALQLARAFDAEP